MSSTGTSDKGLPSTSPRPPKDPEEQTLADSEKTLADSGAAGLAEPHPAVQVPDHELLTRIGQGSYGEVWLARNVMGTYRAVKIVHRAAFEHARPFEREFNGIQKFEPISRSHDGFVDVLQIGRAPEYFYYVMELADDVVTGQQIDPTTYEPKTLRSRVQKGKPLPIEQCVELGLSLTAALAHLHGHGLIHRDVKPSNIIFVNGLPKLADIGLVAEQSEAKSFVGTEGFIPPEGPGTPRADIYSLGKVLYEIATGQDRHEFPALPTRVTDSATGTHLFELNAVLLKACQSDIRLRYQSAEDMRAELLLLQSGKSVAQAQRLALRLALLTRASIAGIILTLCVLVALFYTRSQARREAALRARAERGEQALRHHLYAANLNRAKSSADRNDLGQTLELLNLHRPRPGEPDLRGWEWRYLWNLCGGDQAGILNRSGNEVVALSFLTPERIIAGDIMGPIEVWDLPKERLLTRVCVGSLSDLAISVEKDIIAIAHWGRHVTVRKGLLGLGFMLTHPQNVNCLEVSPDGTMLATAGDNGLTLWDVERREVTQHLHTHSIWADPGFSPDGRKIACIDEEGMVSVWDVATGRSESLPLPGGSEHAFSPNGETLAVGYQNGLIRLFNLQTRTETLAQRHTDRADEIVFSPDGQFMVSAAFSREVCLWRTAPDSEPTVLTGPEKLIGAAAFSPNSELFVTGSKDGTIRLWTTNSKPRPRSEIMNFSGRFLISDNGAHLVAMSTNTVVSFVDLPSLEVTRSKSVPVGCHLADISGAGNWLALLLGGQIKLWNPSHPSPPQSIQDGPGAIQGLSFSPDETHIATFDTNGVLSQFRVADGRRIGSIDLLTDPNRHPLRHVRHSPDGRWVVTVDGDGLVNLVEVASWKRKQIIPTSVLDCRALAFSPDSRLIALCGSLETVELWSIEPFRRMQVLTGGSGGYNSVNFSPDGRRLVAGASGVVRIWELDQFQPVFLVERPGQIFWHVQFTPKIDALVTVSGEWVVEVFRAPTLAEIQSDPRYADGGRASESEARLDQAGPITDWFSLKPTPITTTPDRALESEPLPTDLPKAGTDARTSVVASAQAWRRLVAPDGILRVRNPGGTNVTKVFVTHAISYVAAEQDLEGCVIEAASDDEYQLYLNGEPVLDYTWRRTGRNQPRAYPTRNDRMSGIHLRAGTNVLLLRVVGENEYWTGSIQLADPFGNRLGQVRTRIRAP